MNNKTIIEFGFRIIWGTMEISEGFISLGLRPRRITLSSISIILYKVLSLLHKLLINSAVMNTDYSIFLPWYFGEFFGNFKVFWFTVRFKGKTVRPWAGIPNVRVRRSVIAGLLFSILFNIRKEHLDFGSPHNISVWTVWQVLPCQEN